MPKKLKYYIGNLDGKREGLVLTTSQQRAAAIARTSLHSFREYWHELPASHFAGKDIRPDMLYTRPFLAGEFVSEITCSAVKTQ